MPDDRRNHDRQPTDDGGILYCSSTLRSLGRQLAGTVCQPESHWLT
jgi:hypothetical protein